MHVLTSAVHPLLAAAASGSPLSASFWLTSLGALGVLVVVFAETGLLIGFFLPGDSLLFTAGLFCSANSSSVHLNLFWVLAAAVVGALTGAETGFFIGRRGGRALLERSNNRWLHQGVERAGELLSRYGYAKAIVLARFIPVVRTVLNPLAGMIDVPTGLFTIWQVVGGLIWSVGVTLAGYALGKSIPNIDKYLLPIIAVIVILSAIPVAIEIIRSRRSGNGRDSGGDHGYADDQGYGGDRGYHESGGYGGDRGYRDDRGYREGGGDSPEGRGYRDGGGSRSGRHAR